MKQTNKKNGILDLHKLAFVDVSVMFRFWLIGKHMTRLTKLTWSMSHKGSGLLQLPTWSYMISVSIRANKSYERWHFGEGRLELNITQRQKHLFLCPCFSRIWWLLTWALSEWCLGWSEAEVKFPSHPRCCLRKKELLRQRGLTQEVNMRLETESAIKLSL